MNMATERAENCPRSTDNKIVIADDLQKLILPAEVWVGKSLVALFLYALSLL